MIRLNTNIKIKAKKNLNKKFKSSSRKWLNRQMKDPYIARSHSEGYRSRAAYKLIEINKKFHLFKSGQTIVDLGAAPGGWSQVLVKLLNVPFDQTSSIISLDLLEIKPIKGVTVLKQDFTTPEAIEMIKNQIKQSKVDGVISDMAANTTGHRVTDHIRIVDLCEQALNFALKILNKDGFFVAKIFQGGAQKDILNLAKQYFKKVKHIKPNASRAESTEMYIVASEFKFH